MTAPRVKFNGNVHRFLMDKRMVDLETSGVRVDLDVRPGSLLAVLGGVLPRAALQRVVYSAPTCDDAVTRSI